MNNIFALPTIGIAGVTIPGAVDCINKINQFSCEWFEEFRRPNIKLDQPDFYPTHEAQIESKWNVVANRLVAAIQFLAKSSANFAIIPANTVHLIIEYPLDFRKCRTVPVVGNFARNDVLSLHVTAVV